MVTAQEYFHNVLRVDRIEKFTGNNYGRRQAVQKALKSLGKPYDLINYNCEHFVTEIVTGKAESKQVQNVGLFLLSILLFSAFTD